MIAADRVKDRAVESPHWKRNLYVALFGSFTTVASMTLLLPFLPLYVEHLGVTDPGAIVTWSGIAFAATFLAAGIMAPVWGRVADRYGRKLVLARAGLGMTIAISLTGLAQDVYQLTALRLLAGLIGGYASGAIVLVATQTPKQHSAWALGMLSTGIMAGSLTGPLIGGIMPGLFGLRAIFFAAGAVIFVAFLATVFLIREVPPPRDTRATRSREGAWAAIPDRRPVLAMLLTALLFMLANMSIEPIITVYVAQISPPGTDVPLLAGVVLSASALASIIAAPRIGRLADRIGHWNVVIASLALAGLLLLPQAFVTAGWQLVALRLLMGLVLGGTLPCITAMIRHSVPDRVAGQILGYATSAQFAGQVLGPLLGGVVGAQLGVPAVFIVTAGVMLAGAGVNWVVRRK